MPEPVLRELGPDDLEQADALGRLAFGVAAGEAPAERPVRRQWGAWSEGRLLAKVAVHDHAQWWGGRAVPMAGLSGVAAHPDVRGRGLVRQLVELGLREQGHPVSALFPTAAGIYRSLGWELVGSLDQTRVPLAALPTGGTVPIRSATAADVPALAAAYDAWGRARSGLLTRNGPSFPRGPEGLLEHDVVTVAEAGGSVVAYVAYARGRGMGPDSELAVSELVAADPAARSSLLASLASWGSVVGSVAFRGPTDELAATLPTNLPPPYEQRPWMLRLVDPVAAVAARGWPVDGAVELELAGTGAWRLEVSAGRGRLERLPGRTGLPVVHPRGLAALWAGSAASSTLVRTGLVDRPVPALDALCAGPAPAILDYF